MSRRRQTIELKLPTTVNRCCAMTVAGSVVCSNEFVVCDMHSVGHDKFERLGSERLIDGGFPRMRRRGLPTVCAARRREISGSRLRFGAIWKCKPTNRSLRSMCEAGRDGTDIVIPDPSLVRFAPSQAGLVPSTWCRMAGHRTTAPCRRHLPAMGRLENNSTFVGEIPKTLDRCSSYAWRSIRSVEQETLLRQRLQFCADDACRSRVVHWMEFGFLRRDRSRKNPNPIQLSRKTEQGQFQFGVTT